MTELYEVEEERERVILAAVSVDDTDDTKESLEELEELAKTAGAECVTSVIQNRERIHPGTYFGKGKIEEIAEIIRQTGADGIICDYNYLFDFFFTRKITSAAIPAAPITPRRILNHRQYNKPTCTEETS